MEIRTSSEKVNKAIAIAMNDISINIREYKSGLLEEKRPVLMAGADYDRPWTRDASINTFNFLALYDRELARNTLLSVLLRTKDGIFIDGQYWDCVIWALGAERYLDIHDDPTFNEIAIEAVKNTLSKMEKEEFSDDYGLFRGAAVYGDGVSAYPESYGVSGSSGCILSWPSANPLKKEKTGYGIPMHVLSTNCAYYNAYMMVYRLTGNSSYYKKALDLKKSITNNFYNEGFLKYITGRLGDHYEQEGLGLALGLMFCILPKSILDNVRLTRHGIACIDKTFERYRNGEDLGRHSGTIWSFINCFFANEALKAGRADIFEKEFNLLTEKAIRDSQFYEIYHPVTGLPYGGIQEPVKDGEYSRLKSCEHQAWSATGYLSMLIYGAAGVSIGFEEIRYNLTKMKEIKSIEIMGLDFKGTECNISI